MATPPRNTRLSAEQRSMLALLARIPRGITEDLLVLAHGFDRALIVDLVEAGLVTARREVVTAAGRTIEVVRIRISDTGRLAVEG